MGVLVPRPSRVIQDFREKYEKSPEAATEFFYKFSQDTDYIRRYRVKKDWKWTADSPYGTIDITVNLSKPEKDPKAIAAAKNAAQSRYPKCQLCMENEGYAPGETESQSHSGYGQRQQMGVPVFTVCLLQRALYRI